MLLLALPFVAATPVNVFAEAYEGHRGTAEYHILTETLGDPVGMQDFEGVYAIDNPNEVIEVIVEFRVPPAVALRLLQERGIEAPIPGINASDSFEEQALTAHEMFQQQIGVISESYLVEIFSEHHWLFNGVFMRLPSFMVEQIASLPIVYAVFPNVTFYLDDVTTSDHDYSPDIGEFDTDAGAEFFSNPNFMRQTRDFFNISHIHNNLGITGNGVRVAVIDTGVDHSHPEFARFLDNTGRIPGWHFWHDFHPAHNHGTLVSGAVVGMAPNIDLWNYRVALSGTGGGGTTIGAVEAAHRDGADIITMSFGGGTSPFSAISRPINIAVLDGVVAVSSAGNSGNSGSFTITSPGPEPLLITVGAGTAGGTQQALRGDTIIGLPHFWGSSLGPVSQTYHIKPDIVAPTYVNTTNIGGGYLVANGTSLSAPIIAGIAALLIEAFPNATPYEIKARIMNTARPLADLNPTSVFTVGAGFVQPLEALNANGNAFATVAHLIPVSTVASAPFEMANMASLSFGRFHGHTTDNMVITIHNAGGGTWTPQVNFTGNHTGVSLNVTPSGSNFNARMTFGSNAVPGIYQGNIVFTNGTRRITMPFGVTFDGGGANFVTFGDVNDDGVVNSMDVSLLRMYLAGHSVVINAANADVNADGVINSMDLTLLRMYLAGHDVVLGEQP